MKLSDVALMALQVVAPVLMAALAWAAAKLAALIRSKVANEYLRGALVRLDDAVLTAVKELQQTVVAEVKAASADGKIDDVERQRIKEVALANVKSYLGPKGLAVLAELLGLSGDTLERYLGSRIEAAVHDLRVVDRAVSAPTSAAKTGGALPLASSPR